MKNRKFGVELEFDTGGNGIDEIAAILWKNGFKEDWVGTKEKSGCNPRCYGCSCPRYTFTGVHEDGSEMELKTPILQGKRGFNQLEKVVNILNENGCYTTEYDGLHVHHDAPEFVDNKKLILNLVKSWKYNEEHIASFIEEERAKAAMGTYSWGSPCPTIREEKIEEYENAQGNYTYLHFFTRNNLNVTALREHGTVEFRFHEGTLDFKEIKSWIKFGQYFLNSVKYRKNPIDKSESIPMFLNRIRLENNSKTALLSKAGVNG